MKTEQSRNEAAQWIAYFDRKGLINADTTVEMYTSFDDDFATWLQQTTVHRIEFLRALKAWQSADRLVALQPIRDNLVIFPKTKQKYWPIAAGIAFLMFASFMFTTTEHYLNNDNFAYETRVGGREIVPLEDGSVLELNTNTKLFTKVNDDKRIVTLERGEAFFAIAHDETRPFVVEAGNKRITVLGTKFSVTRQQGEIEVIVTEGKVKFEDLSRQRNANTAKFLLRGDKVTSTNHSEVMTKFDDGALNAALSWRKGMLNFAQTSLAEVAEEFNRYNRRKLIIADQDIASIKIGGSFKAKDIEDFAFLLRDGFGLSIDFQAQQIVVKS